MTSVPATPPPTYQPALLQTRLHPPQLPADVTLRPRIDALVQRGVAHKLLLMTAAAGEPEISAKLKQGYQAGDQQFKVHIDSYNFGLYDYMTGVFSAPFLQGRRLTGKG